MSTHLEDEPVQAQSSGAADRRRHARHAGRAMAEIVRESDPLRHVLRVELIDVSITGIGIATSTILKPDERIRVRLRNVVQRFLKEVRGVVRWTTPDTGGAFRVGIELLAPFTAVDLQMLRRAGIGTKDEASRVWV
jgi:hypothetical protein